MLTFLIIMSRGTAAFVCKVESKLSGSDLRNLIEKKILENVYKSNNVNEARRGYLNLNLETSESPSRKLPEFYYYEKENKLISIYREYTVAYDKYERINRPIINDIDTIYDIQKRLLIFRTSDTSTANKMIQMFNDRESSTLLRLPLYVQNEEFFRWIIINAKNGRDKLPPSCKLQNIDGVYIKDFQGTDKYATTESVRIKSIEDISEDSIYKPIKDQGERTYIKGNFLHARWTYRVTIYKNGKITLGSKPEGVDNYIFYGMFGIAFEEMENIFRYRL